LPTGLESISGYAKFEMLTLWFERHHNVLMARLTGVLSSDDLDSHDRSVLQFLAGRRGVRAIYDFSAVEILAVPASKIAQRGQRPAIIGGRRVVVAPHEAGAQFVRIIREQQSAAGLPEPTIVKSLEEAYALLGLDHTAEFQAVDKA
jgi:hypothetical protein